MNKTLAISLAASLIALTGCATEIDSQVRTIEANLSDNSCNENSGINPMKAALAVAMASELGRLDPVGDLKISGDQVALKWTAKKECQARGFGNCPNTAAILGMQDVGVNEYIDQSIFNAVSFKEDLKASFDRQANHETNLAQNHPDQLPQEHQLFETGVSDYGSCGIHYDYSANGEKIENLANRMVFFGGEENPFIDFRSDDSSIAIDPTGTMNGDEDTESGLCTVGCYGYGKSLRYTCCACEGASGTYMRAPWDSNMVYCAY